MPRTDANVIFFLLLLALACGTLSDAKGRETNFAIAPLEVPVDDIGEEVDSGGATMSVVNVIDDIQL